MPAAKPVTVKQVKPRQSRRPSAPRFLGTLDYLITHLKGGMRQAVIMADYGPYADDRTHAVLTEFEATKRHLPFALEASCKANKLKASEFIGAVVAGMNKYRIDYTEIIRAQELPELIEQSYKFAKADPIVGWLDRHELMKAAGAHLAPKAAQVIIDNRDQSQTANIGLRSFEDTLAEMESVGQRRLPESSAVEAEFVSVKEEEYVAR